MIMTVSDLESQPTTVRKILAAWGTHEGRGRLAHKRSAPAQSSDYREQLIWTAVRNLDSDDDATREAAAVDIVVHSRTLILADILKADPTGECLEILIDVSELPTLYNFRRRPFVAWSRSLQDDGHRFIRSLTRTDIEEGGPLAAIGTGASGPFALMDGNHRAAAWAKQQNAGDLYPLRLAVIVVREVRLHGCPDDRRPA
jgi:hypothetical protein